MSTSIITSAAQCAQCVIYAGNFFAYKPRASKEGRVLLVVQNGMGDVGGNKTAISIKQRYYECCSVFMRSFTVITCFTDQHTRMTAC